MCENSSNNVITSSVPCSSESDAKNGNFGYEKSNTKTLKNSKRMSEILPPQIIDPVDQEINENYDNYKQTSSENETEQIIQISHSPDPVFLDLNPAINNSSAIRSSAVRKSSVVDFELSQSQILSPFKDSGQIKS